MLFNEKAREKTHKHSMRMRKNSCHDVALRQVAVQYICHRNHGLACMVAENDGQEGTGKFHDLIRRRGPIRDGQQSSTFGFFRTRRGGPITVKERTHLWHALDGTGKNHFVAFWIDILTINKQQIGNFYLPKLTSFQALNCLIWFLYRFKKNTCLCFYGFNQKITWLK